MTILDHPDAQALLADADLPAAAVAACADRLSAFAQRYLPLFHRSEQRDHALAILRGKLTGLLIEARSFPGWDSFGALIQHLKFLRDHHRKIDRVAVFLASADAGYITGQVLTVDGGLSLGAVSG